MHAESINIAEAKKHISELIGQVAYSKKEVLITKRGKPMARLVPVDAPECRLRDSQGWLENDDPFFQAIDGIVEDRGSRIPRALSEPDAD